MLSSTISAHVSSERFPSQVGGIPRFEWRLATKSRTAWRTAVSSSRAKRTWTCGFAGEGPHFASLQAGAYRADRMAEGSERADLRGGGLWHRGRCVRCGAGVDRIGQEGE